MFCRRDLPTLLYTPKAANLGDLMRLLVRPRVRNIATCGVSRTSRRTQSTPDNNVICPSISTTTTQKRLSRRNTMSKKEHPSQNFYVRSHVHLCYNGVATSWLRNSSPKPCRDPKQSLRARSTPCSQDRLTHVDLLFT